MILYKMYFSTNILSVGASLLYLFITANAFNDTQCNQLQYFNFLREQPKKTFRLMQYNVEWLFTNVYNNCPGSGCTWANESEAYIHLSYVENVIDDLSPDLVNLCEVEGCDELNLLNSQGIYTPYLLFGTDSSTGQNVGMLKRSQPLDILARTSDKVNYPVPGSTCGYVGSPGSEGVSKHYYTRILLGNTFVHVIGLHLLAYPDNITRCAEREAQAQVVQRLVVGILADFPDDEIIVMGDINDFDAEVADLNDNKPISMVLDILKGYAGEFAGQYELSTVANLVDKKERYTDWWDKDTNCVATTDEYSMIDHILMTQRLYDTIINVTYYHGYKEYCGKYDTDHFPILVDFDISFL